MVGKEEEKNLLVGANKCCSPIQEYFSKIIFLTFFREDFDFNCYLSFQYNEREQFLGTLFWEKCCFRRGAHSGQACSLRANFLIRN